MPRDETAVRIMAGFLHTAIEDGAEFPRTQAGRYFMQAYRASLAEARHLVLEAVARYDIPT